MNKAIDIKIWSTGVWYVVIMKFDILLIIQQNSFLGHIVVF